ncbi:hypothetical protein OG216_44125 [Streptomycetaceae bacterium NBC_01309]
MVLGAASQSPKIVYGFAEPQARFVVLWAPDHGGGIAAARDAYLEHQAKVDPWSTRRRRHYFTPVVGGVNGYGHLPREAASVPLLQIVGVSGRDNAYSWGVWVPELAWWPLHGPYFLEARPEVGWSAGEPW